LRSHFSPVCGDKCDIDGGKSGASGVRADA
jgi:hypothetical protein